jgi:lipopolysaccharide export system protein LptA
MTLLPTPLRRRSPPCRLALVLALTASALFSAPLHAERADRTKPLNVAADRDGRLDLVKQVLVFSGNVVITKGTIVIKAAQVEVREGSDGYRNALAIGSSGQQATFRQKRDGVDEYIDGQADRLEYDERGDTIRFIGNATVRRLRGTTTADEINGSLITYDNTSEVFSVSGGPVAGGAASPGGRVRAVLTPREGTPAAAEAASQAGRSAPSGDVRR